MRINVYLSFPGTCEEALNFYQSVLGGEMLPFHYYKGSPAEAQVSEDWQDKVMHGSLQVGALHLMGSDQPPEQFETPQGYWLSVNNDTAEEADRIFNAIGEGGNVVMPIGETFWAKRFGMVTDRYGINWMVDCE